MYKKAFYFRQDRQLKKINLDSIIYLEAAKNYTRLYTSINNMYIARITLIEAMKLLPKDKFIRIHRSFAVATEHIDTVGRDILKLATIPVEIPVSRLYYVAFTKQITILDSAAIDKGKMVKAPKKKPRKKLLWVD
jgi:DNA-binding LytR/AlgR family response regulator